MVRGGEHVLDGDAHVLVVDVGFGDAGKGTIVDFLASEHASGAAPVAVVRFNGGAQAAHNVVLPDGRHHTFAQFGAATLRGVPTHLSRFALVEPVALAAEAEHLACLGVPDPFALLSVDRRALLTTPYHAAANRARETARGEHRHGSCGVGVGETMRFALAHPDLAPRVGDCTSPATLARKLGALADFYRAEFPTAAPLAGVPELLDVYAAFAGAVRLVDESHLPRLLAAGRVVFEGAQGVLLDEWRGFDPYTTWSTTTFGNALELLADAGADPAAAVRLGVLRTATTRHGAGPLVTEDAALTAAWPERHNRTGRWQGAFRVGHFDVVAHRYALEVAGGVDALALTHLDVAADVAHLRGSMNLRVCRGYDIDGTHVDRLVPGPFADLAYQRQLTGQLLRAVPRLSDPLGDEDSVPDWVATVEAELGEPVAVASWGPSAADKRVQVTVR